MSTTSLVRALGALFVAAVALIGTLATAPAAHASCAVSPLASPNRFTGVVLGTELGGRLAYVATDDGRSVVVRGTVSDVDDAFTTVDRTYVTGHRYEFHPVSSTSPYEDNICTATLDLGLAPTPTTTPVASPELELVGDETGTSPVALWSFGAGLGAVLLVTGIVLVRRSRPAEDATQPDDTPVEGDLGQA